MINNESTSEENNDNEFELFTEANCEKELTIRKASRADYWMMEEIDTLNEFDRELFPSTNYGERKLSQMIVDHGIDNGLNPLDRYPEENLFLPNSLDYYNAENVNSGRPIIQNGEVTSSLHEVNQNREVTNARGFYNNDFFTAEEETKLANQSTCCDDTDNFKVPCHIRHRNEEGEENLDLYKENLLDDLENEETPIAEQTNENLTKNSGKKLDEEYLNLNYGSYIGEVNSNINNNEINNYLLLNKSELSTNSNSLKSNIFFDESDNVVNGLNPFSNLDYCINLNNVESLNRNRLNQTLCKSYLEGVDYNLINDLNYLDLIVKKSLSEKSICRALTQPEFISNLTSESYSHLISSLYENKYNNIFDICLYLIQTSILKYDSTIEISHVANISNGSNLRLGKENDLYSRRLKEIFKSILELNVTKSLTYGNATNSSGESMSSNNISASASEKKLREANVRKQGKTLFNKAVILMLNALLFIVFKNQELQLNTLKFNDPHRKNNITFLDKSIMEILYHDNPRNYPIKKLIEQVNKGTVQIELNNPTICLTFQLLHAFLSLSFEDCFSQLYNSKLFDNVCSKNITRKQGKDFCSEFHYYAKSFINYIKEEK